MKAVSKILIAACAAASTLVAAAPAEAQYRSYRHDRGIDAGDVIAGVAILGGIAAVASAINRDGGRYGYDYRYRYRDGYTYAVNACGGEAERYGRGRVRITDIDRWGSDRFKVKGVIEGGYGYNRYDRNGERFTCYAYGNGRIADFRLRDRAW